MSDEEQQESPRGGAAEEESGTCSDAEEDGAKKIRFRNKAEWKQINHFPLEGKAEDENQRLMLVSATDQLRPWMPSIFEDYKKLDTDLYCWKRKETSKSLKNTCLSTF